MPDWTYAPLFRPLLERLGPRRARATALGAMGALASSTAGARFIEAFGDMAAPPSLRRRYGALDLAGPVGFGTGVDPELRAVRALARFGAGFIEVGPVTRDPVAGGAILRDDTARTIVVEEPLENPGLAAVRSRVRSAAGPARLAIRLAHARGASPAAAADEISETLAALAAAAAFVTLDLRSAFDDAWDVRSCERHIASCCHMARALRSAVPLFVALPADLDGETMRALARVARAAGAVGASVSGGIVAPSGGATFGATTRAASLAAVAALRDELGEEAILIGSGGIGSPADALAFFAAGATLVQIDSGLVFSGPGIVKRIDEALVACERPRDGAPAAFSWRSRWVWGTIYGAALSLVSVLVLIVALTQVVLPYDLVFLGMTRRGLEALDPRLLPFMVHDRVTAGGATLSIAMLYTALAYFGIRSGERWAWRAMLDSSVVGFASYWLWLRLGYFEPLHTLATVSLLPIFVATIVAKMPLLPHRVVDANDRAWRRSLVAQLLFVIVGVGFVIGGVTISVVGVTSIFVQTDLVYLHATAAGLIAANSHLVPLIAHDRAGFGGALAADGIVLTLVAMWGFRRGVAWLWWTLLLSGLPGFFATLIVHVAVGYTDSWHLAPVAFALLLYAAALVLARPYLCRTLAETRHDPCESNGV